MNYGEALELATKVHKGQIRENSGEDYIVHPIAVADKFNDADRKIVAVLHDTIEDTELTLDDLKDLKLRPDLIHVIDLLTHKPDQTYLDYLLHIRDVPMAKEIKVEDLNHNLSDVRKGCSERCSRDKYIMALYILNSYTIVRKVTGKERQKIIDKLESGKTVSNLDSFSNKFKYYVLGYVLDR